MKKKLLGVLLSLAMALNFTVVSAFAVEKPTVTVETAANAVEAGATVALSVSIKGNTGFTNYEWNIQYDKDRLELTTIESDLDIISNTNHPKTGFGYATCARANPYNKDAKLFTLTFTVKEDAKTGNAEVKIESDNFKNNGVAIDADYVVGGVTVNGSTTGGSTTGGSTTGGSTTGGSTTGGSTTGGSTTGGSTTGGSTTGGSTTGGSTTGGSTTGGSTTGGSTTGGSTTGGSTTGGSTTGGSTTGGSTTGGSTTGGSTTGGSSTGGSGSTGGVAKDNVTVTPATPTVSFTDVPASAYYYDAVKWAAKKGITSGIGSGLFGPDQPCTRAQIVTFLWRAAGSPEPKSMSSFSDVSADSYYAKAVAWAVENGITTGTGDGKFSPDATCTRAQSVTFLFRAIGKLVDSKAEFSDVLTDSYYANAVAWAVENGVTNGIGDGLFGPDNSCTRAQIVTFLFRAYQGK